MSDSSLNRDSFKITCDSNSDISLDVVKKYGYEMMLMPYTIDDVEFVREPDEEFDDIGFYKSMREGALVKTVARNSEEFKQMWSPFLEGGQDILHIAFSSALSGTFQNAIFAKEEMEKKYPERKIILVDSLLIALALGLLLVAVGEQKLAGKSMEEIAEYVEREKLCYAAVAAPENLKYLRRGGRLSAASAAFGTLLDVKPIIKISNEGTLVPVTKCKGRKKTLKYVVNTVIENVRSQEGDSIYVIHADAEDDAGAIVEMLKDGGIGIPIRVKAIGPVIGAHIGPGAIGVCFIGNRDFE